jgi:hypothetical protein
MPQPWEADLTRDEPFPVPKKRKVATNVGRYGYTTELIYQRDDIRSFLRRCMLVLVAGQCHDHEGEGDELMVGSL